MCLRRIASNGRDRPWALPSSWGVVAPGQAPCQHLHRYSGPTRQVLSCRARPSARPRCARPVARASRCAPSPPRRPHRGGACARCARADRRGSTRRASRGGRGPPLWGRAAGRARARASSGPPCPPRCPSRLRSRQSAVAAPQACSRGAFCTSARTSAACALRADARARHGRIAAACQWR